MAYGYVSSSDPKKAAQNTRDWAQYRGDQLGVSADKTQQDELARRNQSASYLDSLYSPMAEGRGGYSADESAAILGNPNAVVDTVNDYASKIEMSPDERQAIETGAGITAGNQYRSAVDSTTRAAKAAGMGPMGVAAYRQRMAREGAGESADALTKARVGAGAASADRAATVMGAKTGAQQYADTVGSGRSQTIADTRLGQQAQGLGYYTGQNTQANANANAAADRAVGVYGTQAGATNDAVRNQTQASQIPSTWQKIAGAATGAIGALGGAAGIKSLADGGVVVEPTLAYIGEDGPEAVVPLDGRQEAKVRPSKYYGR